MKLRNVLAVAAVALLVSSVAFGQIIGTSGTNTTTKVCNGPAPGSPVTAGLVTDCQVEGKTLLVASYQEGISITVPNQINFHLIPGQLAQGDSDLVAVTNWYLNPDYSEIWVDAFFKDADNTLTASDPGPTGMGANIPASAILAQQNGAGGTSAFGDPLTMLNANDPINMVPETDVVAAFPIKMIALTNVAAAGTPGAGNYVGQDQSYLRLWIDFRPTSPLYTGGTNEIMPSATGTWAGYVYVRAQAY